VSDFVYMLLLVFFPRLTLC